MILFVDTETSGLINRALPMDAPEQPWPHQVAAELTDDSGQPLSPPQHISFSVRAQGRKIHTEAEKVTGVTSTAAAKQGVPEWLVMATLCTFAAQATYVVGHNIQRFDNPIITRSLRGIEGIADSAYAWLATAGQTRNNKRLGEIMKAFVEDARLCEKMWIRPGLTFIDTMIAATPICKLEQAGDFAGTYKYPSLDECCSILLKEEPRQGIHTAWDDMQRAKRVYLALRDMGAIEAEAA